MDQTCTLLGYGDMVIIHICHLKINLGLNLFVENVTIYEKGNPCAVIGVEAEYEHSQWVTITLAERMKNEERSKWFSPGLKAPSQKTRQIKVISYPRDDRLVPDIDGISVLGRSKLKDTCSKLSVTSCVPCECDKDGSTSLKCDVNGKCKCKDHYIGRRCDSRDCGYTAWTSWTGCNDCNVHGKKESRNRTETHSWKGNGRMCPALYEVRNCTFKQCDCHNGEYGPNCSKRDCVVSQWGNWDRSCTDNCRWNGVRRRTRSKEVDVKGDGRPCPSTVDTITCPYIRCSYHCARLPNYRRVCKWSKY
ncbi:hypothetical protein FSP39_014785 [Pinctada imbricata]|uniref:Laminin EGF-like domain-containing protein n=1 Tax=Pinctada imbricata TaxID=66713 RepID=A0AA88YHI4_PINIB|nr:hypothetical protein FSP39_014785 [Pinctada imbricata]